MAAQVRKSAFDPTLQRFLVWAVVLITSSYTFLDYWNYSRSVHDNGGVEWTSLLAGHGFAPAQYRVGVLRTANLLAELTHTHLRHMFAAIDLVCVGTSLALLLACGAALIFFLARFWRARRPTSAAKPAARV